MSNSAEFINRIPNFSLKDSPGGTVVNELNVSGDIAWEADTAMGNVEFYWNSEELKVLSKGMGLGVIYDEAGKISFLRVDFLVFLKRLISEHKDEDGVDKLRDLANILESNKKYLMAHVQVNEGVYGIYSYDPTSKVMDPVSVYQKDGFDDPRAIQMFVEEYNVCMMFQKIEDEFCLGVGLVDEYREVNKYNEYGEYNEDEDIDEEQAMMLVKYIESDCNYNTYLDSKRGDRFDRLARRIFLG